MRISPPNAAIKVNSLVKKAISARYSPRRTAGNIIWRSREKYIDYYNISSSYMAEVMDALCTASGGGLRQAGGDTDCGEPELMPEVRCDDAEQKK